MSVLNEQVCQKQTVIIFKLTKYDGYQYEASKGENRFYERLKHSNKQRPPPV